MKFIYFAKQLVNVEHIVAIGKVHSDLSYAKYFIEAVPSNGENIREFFSEPEKMDDRFKIIAKQLGVQ